VIEVIALNKSFGWRKVLNGLDLKVRKGRFLTLFGPNGAGKTTLTRIICTLIRPDSGEIIVNDFNTKDDASEVRRCIGVVSHNPYLYEELTGPENLRFYGRLYGIPSNDVNRRAKKLIDEMALTPWKTDPVSSYSRGMKQRLSIARALIHKPSVLILDEPFSGLDVSSTDALIHILHRFHEDDQTVLMTTHDLTIGLSLSDEFAILHGGTIRERGESSTITVENLKNSYRKITGSVGGDEA